MRPTRSDDAARTLVIGGGSIGQRHARLLGTLGCDVRIVSRRSDAGDYDDIEHAIDAWAPEYVVLATETGARHTALAALRDYSGRLLVEKPLGSAPPAWSRTPNTTWLGYNLRFHPVVTALRAHLKSVDILTVQARAGQYLPDWRPGRDYRTTASNEIGGGVLRDLSHEIDLLEWLVGPCLSVAALTEQVSDLDLSVEDVSATLMRFERAPVVTLELNYLDRVAQRSMLITTNDHLIAADLIRGTLTIDGEIVFESSPGRDDTYLAMHRAILSGETDTVCTDKEGQRVMDILEGIEEAATTHAWVGL